MRTATRVFLGLSALLWLPYGLFCFVQPGYLAEAAGVTIGSTTASIELRAMYGGLQVAIGLLALLAVFRPALVRPALLMLAFVTAGLGSARLLGSALDAEVSAYTGLALCFELASAGVAIWLLRSLPPEAAA
jgi:hypothetical protein